MEGVFFGRINQGLNAFPIDDRIEGSGWIEASGLSIEINDPATPTDRGFSNFAAVIQNPGGLTSTYFNLNSKGQYHLEPGDIVTITDVISW